MEAKPDCYGLLWEVIPGSPCNQCHAKHDCLQKFSLEFLPQVVAENPGVTLADLERITGVRVEALRLAYDYRHKTSGVDDRPVEVAALAVNPSESSLATHAAGLDTSEKTSAESVEGAELVPPYSPHPWHDPRWKAQYERERRRSALIGMITPGVKLTRKYKGKLYEVEAREGYYLYQARPYSTLYQIVKEITGAIEYPRPRVNGVRPAGTRKMSNWSVPRFFSLGVKQGDQLRGQVAL